jgi:SAM-dependent methyltransferase
LRKVVKSFWLNKLIWQMNKYKELNDLRQCYAASRGSEDFKLRMDPDNRLQPELEALLPRLKTVKILDVGSGGLSTVGRTAPGHLIELVAVDALADEINAICADLKIAQPSPPIFGEAELLADQFGCNAFDIVHCRNALDHVYDPVAALQAMLDVAKRGGYVYLYHRMNEGRRSCYNGLHQWNFTYAENDVAINGFEGTFTLGKILKGKTYRFYQWGEFIEVIIKK